MTQPADTKLARRLQKRGKWQSYMACLRQVQKRLETTDATPSEIRAAIDRGELDPKEQRS